MKPGQIVTDRFEVFECVGSGTCGAVYRAWDRVLEREVAIKQLDRAIDERVMCTSRAAARLSHPAIVPLFEVGEADGTAFLVSEYIDGLTLRQAHDRGLLTDRDVAEIGVELCNGLQHAHERGVVHGDIKPENVIVRTRDENPDQRSGRCQAKLRDFATREIAHGEGEAEPSREGPYLTPEQIDGAEAGPASDVFGAALVLFECWTGRNPLAGVTTPRLARIRWRHIPSLADLRPDLPVGLVGMIDAALDADPGNRPGPLELGEWLDHVFDDLDYELAVPEPVVADPRPDARVGVVASVATVAGAALASLAGLAPAAFALASWPGSARHRAGLGLATALVALVVPAALDPSSSMVALEGEGLAGLVSPYALLLAALWTASAVTLGGLARAPSPVSGAALGTAFSLAVLIAGELLARASEASSLSLLGPMALIAALAAAAAISISRHSARGWDAGPGDAAGEPEPSAPLGDLMPPELDDAEFRVSAQPPLRVADPVETAHVT